MFRKAESGARPMTCSRGSTVGRKGQQALESDSADLDLMFIQVGNVLVWLSPRCFSLNGPRLN